MVSNKEKPPNPKKTLKKKQENILDVTKNYTQTVEHGKQIGRETMEKINQATHNAGDFIKSQEYLKALKINSLQIREKGIEQKNLLKKNSPKFYKKIVNGFFYFFELIVGRIKLGTQYGSASLEILEKLAKLKELGIITDREFNEKKKKILDRI
ncbi:SHOCT domain-containing protein [Candidatus Nitrosopumilus sp. SW]|uniref:SHOCT domain-containing protein n=1 Tax=Candidatus Nitrosopumilus sp. SW TaxID=2508726 RepID=UPI00115205C1|nr:SHOCT domain-containing protein [Candidatus Nitrosopumilus sp. SW]QDI89512.1 SHOCT domain-containing protein [Candidatus Nitrosopumilus sp. SW]